MAKPKDDSNKFIHEFYLRPDAQARKALEHRFRIGHNITNVLIQEALRRLNGLQADLRYQNNRSAYKNSLDEFGGGIRFLEAKIEALETSKKEGVGGDIKLLKAKLAKLKALHKERLELIKEYELSGNYCLEKFITNNIYKAHQTWARPYTLGCFPLRILGQRIAITIQNYLRKGGKRYGKPKFQSIIKSPLNCIQDSSSSPSMKLTYEGRKTFITWKTPYFDDNGKRQFPALKIPVHCDRKGKDKVEQTALCSELRNIRIIRRKIRGSYRYYAQITFAGEQYKIDKAPVEGVIGLDLGPQTIAISTDEKATFNLLSPSVRTNWKEVRRIQRAMDRSLRSTNPEHFDEKGRFKKGIKTKMVRSKRYHLLQSELADASRRLATRRKIEHYTLAKNLLSKANVIKVEKCSYVAWQKNYGKSIGQAAPGAFIEILKRKAKSVNATIIDINTFETSLSQLCHFCGKHTKKKLKERVHNCMHCNAGPFHRDKYSAWLARYVEVDVNDKQTVNLERAREEFNEQHVLIS